MERYLNLWAESLPQLLASTVAVTIPLSLIYFVLALLVGNVLSTPMRGLRHQLPSYAAYYPTALAIKLIVINQGLRALSMIAMTAVYWALAF